LQSDKATATAAASSGRFRRNRLGIPSFATSGE
jgi:hypothetical protein